MTDRFLQPKTNTSSLGGETKAEKEAEVQQLLEQLRIADPDNVSLLLLLNSQLGNLHYNLSQFKKALPYWEQSLVLVRQIGNRSGESATLDNMGAIHFEQYHDLKTATQYFLQAYYLLDQIGPSDIKFPKNHLDAIIEEIGEERFKEIRHSIGVAPDGEKEQVESESSFKVDQDFHLGDDYADKQP